MRDPENKDAHRQAGIPEHSVFEFAACRQRAAGSLARHCFVRRPRRLVCGERAAAIYCVTVPEHISFEMPRIPKLKIRLLRRLAMLSSSVKLEDSLTGEATAQINCAYGIVARGCSPSLVRAC